MPNVVVVGGGLTGLTVAYRLKQFAPDVSVTVLEPQVRPGGNVGTEDHRGFRVERGPNGFLDRTTSVPDLVRDLGLAHRQLAASEGSRKNRYVFVGEKLHKLPRGPLGLLFTPLLSLRGKWQLISERWRKARPLAGAAGSSDESIQDFITRRAGKEAADIFGDALVTGIHGGDPKLLSVAATFPRLPVMERESGSIIKGFMRAAKQRRRELKARGERPGPMKMWSFREGMQVLTDALAEKLDGAVKCNAAARSISEAASVAPWKVYGEGGRAWSADAVVLACPSYEQAAILHELNPKLADELAAIPYNRIAVVALGYRQTDCPGAIDGFGYIAPQNTRRDVLGVQWCSSIFPDRAPSGCVLWRALCGGVHRAEQLDWDDDRLAKAVHAEIKLAMGVTGEPVFRRIVRWRAAIPQYVIGHLDRVARIDVLAAAYPGLFLAGNSLRGVAMADCVEQSGLLAARVANYVLSTAVM